MATTEIMSALRIASVTFDLRWRQETSGQRGGAIRVADIGEALWFARIRTSPRMRKTELIQLQAKIGALKGSIGTFLVWNPLAEYPQADPTGSILGAAAVTVHSVVDGSNLKLKALPAGYVLTAGDFLEILFASPEQRGLHQIVIGGAANGSGITPTLTIVPSLWAGAAADQAVSLIKPATEMRLVPGSYEPAMAGPLRGSIGFDAIQALVA